MKRYYCPECGKVHTVRPLCFEPRITVPSCIIYISILLKLKEAMWLSLFSRQRQQNWWRNFKRRVAADGLGRDLRNSLYELTGKCSPLGGYALFLPERKPVSQLPYLSFAETKSATPP